MKPHLIVCAAIALACASAASAAPIVNGFDLATFDFDVTQYSTGTNEFVDATASGTSNGIAWSISPTSLWSGRTTTNGTFGFNALPNPTDNLHPGLSYTITFAQPIDTLIVALSNDNTSDSINFNLVPSFMYGNVTAVGTQIVLTDASGGLAWFTNVNSLQITNIDNNGITDGYDLAFHAIAAVPEPSAYALLAGGIGMLGVMGWRRKAA
jgi:hypothetical protein